MKPNMSVSELAPIRWFLLAGQDVTAVSAALFPSWRRLPAAVDDPPTCELAEHGADGHRCRHRASMSLIWYCLRPDRESFDVWLPARRRRRWGFILCH